MKCCSRCLQNSEMTDYVLHNCFSLNMLHTLDQRLYLDKVARFFGIKQPHEWGKLLLKDIRNNGGGALLKSYNNSLIELLRANYPGW